jgi:drug/metabolite transporter superfamily protein YnfA
MLVVCGFLPKMQPTCSFGRINAVISIVLALLWGWGFDGDQPDKGMLWEA